MMDEKELERFRKQHVENYKSVILENIKNNSNVLIDDDIHSLLSKPPLDSMDFLKMKFLTCAKKYKVVLNTEELDDLLNLYRNSVLRICDSLKKIRVDELSSKVRSIKLEEDDEIIKILKKDFVQVNKEMKNILKKQLNESYENIIMPNIYKVFSNDVDFEVKDKVILEIAKYIKGAYQKQLMENIDIKIMVKDTTLMNVSKEQSERYLFTLNNSRLLNDSFE